eukprot:TRINITY_DN36490_c0_g1_i1.p1 TRINITY_DN36490_c0_g1~~TRINITY_DN36490_c0_g1_i1.p1  ORF type:complete len:147 (-),score=42.21 TRINITY_DN36490_c0_g1_i1:100-540(-)
MAGNGPNAILTHAQRVCRLYKRSLRCLEDWAHKREDYRFKAVMLRARFDETRKIKDMRVLAQQLEEGEAELAANSHEDPVVFKSDPGGIVYRRALPHEDWLYDQYHPWEQCLMRDFFDNREKLKEEYNTYFEKSLSKKYKPEPNVV